MKDNILCDLETGICGPAGISTTTTGFIDLTAPLDLEVEHKEQQASPISDQTENEV